MEYQILKEKPYHCKKCDRFIWFTSLIEPKYCHACFSLWLQKKFPVIKETE